MQIIAQFITVFCNEPSSCQYLAGMWIPHWHYIFQMERSQCVRTNMLSQSHC